MEYNKIEVQFPVGFGNSFDSEETVFNTCNSTINYGKDMLDKAADMVDSDGDVNIIMDLFSNALSCYNDANVFSDIVCHLGLDRNTRDRAKVIKGHINGIINCKAYKIRIYKIISYVTKFDLSLVKDPEHINIIRGIIKEDASKGSFLDIQGMEELIAHKGAVNDIINNLLERFHYDSNHLLFDESSLGGFPKDLLNGHLRKLQRKTGNGSIETVGKYALSPKDYYLIWSNRNTLPPKTADTLFRYFDNFYIEACQNLEILALYHDKMKELTKAPFESYFASCEYQGDARNNSILLKEVVDIMESFKMIFTNGPDSQNISLPVDVLSFYEKIRDENRWFTEINQMSRRYFSIIQVIQLLDIILKGKGIKILISTHSLKHQSHTRAYSNFTNCPPLVPDIHNDSDLSSEDEEISNEFGQHNFKIPKNKKWSEKIDILYFVEESSSKVIGKIEICFSSADRNFEGNVHCLPWKLFPQQGIGVEDVEGQKPTPTLPMIVNFKSINANSGDKLLYSRITFTEAVELFGELGQALALLFTNLKYSMSLLFPAIIEAKYLMPRIFKAFFFDSKFIADNFEDTDTREPIPQELAEDLAKGFKLLECLTLHKTARYAAIHHCFHSPYDGTLLNFFKREFLLTGSELKTQSLEYIYSDLVYISTDTEQEHNTSLNIIRIAFNIAYAFMQEYHNGDLIRFSRLFFDYFIPYVRGPYDLSKVISELCGGEPTNRILFKQITSSDIFDAISSWIRH